MSDKSNYRPRSPDLSAFAAPPPHLSRLPSYPNTSFPAFSPRGSYDASPYFSPQSSQTPTSYFGTQAQSQTPTSTSPRTARTPSVPVLPHQEPFGQQPQSFSQPSSRIPPARTPSFSAPQYPSQPQTYNPTSYPPVLSQPNFDMARTRKQVKSEVTDEDYPPDTVGMPLNRAPPPPAPIDTKSVNVATKFPVARIKRIMQADEEVGKVAQATPTAVAKALESFMVDIIAGAATEARTEGSKRVTANHLKRTVENNPNFDFLKDTVANAPDENAGGAKKGRSKSEDSDEEMGGTGQSQRKKGKGKKSRGGGSDDSE